MWEILIIAYSCLCFWSAYTSNAQPKIEEEDDKDLGPLAALYFSGFWEED